MVWSQNWMTSSAEMSLKSRPISTVSVFLRASWFSMSNFFKNYCKQRCTRGYKRYKETSGLIEWKERQIFHSIFT